MIKDFYFDLMYWFCSLRVITHTGHMMNLLKDRMDISVQMEANMQTRKSCLKILVSFIAVSDVIKCFAVPYSI